MRVYTDKGLRAVREEITGKAGMNHLENMNVQIMDKLSELLANFENIFADKEGTRKKHAALEKAVRLQLYP